MIKAITIENFKSISEPVTIDFKPITLLFGANSVGKSSIFHALYYLHKMLTQQGNKTDKIIYYDYGDFVSMVHNNDPAKDISITLDSDIFMWPSEYFFSLVNMLCDFRHTNERNTEFKRIMDGIANHRASLPRVKIKISSGIIAILDPVNPTIKLIEVDFMRTKINIDYTASRITISDIENLLVYFAHFSDSDCGCSCCEGAVSELSKQLVEELMDFDEVLLGDDMSRDYNDMYRNEDNNIIINYDGTYPYIIHGDTFAVYRTDPMKLNLQAFLLKFINIFTFGIFENIVEDLNQALYIKPLRDMPLRDATYLFTDGNSIQSINSWLGAGRFDTGLYFDNERQYTVSLTNEEYAALNKIKKKDLIEKISIVSEKPVLKRIGSNQRVNLSDVGFGISQLLPIIDAYSRDTNDSRREYSCVFIEQPELHLHPRMQTVLADMAISWSHKILQSKRRNYLYATKHKTMIETHSEHLLLRLMRRISETSENTLPEGCDPITPEQVAIYYLERKDGVVCARKLEVTPDGDSSGEWPSGFFEERAGELF